MGYSCGVDCSIPIPHFLISGLNEPTSNGLNLREKFRNFVKSLVIHTEKHPLRLIFITDLRSVFQIEKTFEDALPPFDLENKTPDGVKVQRFSREYVQVHDWPRLSGRQYKY